MPHPERQKLKRTLGMRDLLTLIVGTMVGGVWVMLAGGWVEQAGVVGAIAAFALGTVLCVFVSLTYAELTPALPLAGGEVVFSYRGLGYYAAWVTGWMTALAYVGIVAWEGLAMATAIDNLIGVPRFGHLWTVAGFDVYLSWALVGAAGGLVLTGVNYMGVRAAVVLQSAAVLGVAIGGVCFLAGSVTYGSAANMTPAFTTAGGLIAVLVMVPAMLAGFDILPQMAEEVDIPLRKIPRMLVISICLAAAWYILIIVGTSLAAPAGVRTAGTISVADSFAYGTGSPALGKFMIVVGLCGTLTSWNGFFIASTRLLFSMGRARMLPALFGRVHPVRRTPVAAIALVGAIACAAPLLGKAALVWLVHASSFGSVFAYSMVTLSFLALRKYEPNLKRPYRVKGGALAGIPALGACCFFLYLYLPFGPGALRLAEWAMVFGWVMLGITLFALTQERYRSISPEDREYLLLGDEHARPAYTMDPILFSMTRPRHDILSQEERDFLVSGFRLAQEEPGYKPSGRVLGNRPPAKDIPQGRKGK